MAGMREWKPGNVAMLPSGFVAVVDSAGNFVYGAQPLEYAKSRSANGREARPLVVIDPEDHEQVKRLGDALADAFAERHPEVYGAAPDLADEDDDAITRQALRSLVTPPKPDEPQGLGAVVEDAKGDLWVRLLRAGDDSTRDDWQRAGYDDGASDGRRWHFWRDIAAVKVLSDGVQP